MSSKPNESLNERLDRLRELVQDRDFLEGRGLSNEVNIRIFCYDPQDEMAVAHFLSQLLADSSLQCRLLDCNLYRIFIEICEDLDIMESIPLMEDEEGSSYLLEQLHTAVDKDEFVEKLREKYHPQTGDVLVLSGIGDAFPYLRVFNLLEAIQPFFSNIPILVLYPGSFDGSYLKLFNCLKPNHYYRAFNIV